MKIYKVEISFINCFIIEGVYFKKLSSAHKLKKKLELENKKKPVYGNRIICIKEIEVVIK